MNEQQTEYRNELRKTGHAHAAELVAHVNSGRSDDHVVENLQRIRVDRKLRQKIEEKKQAMGIRME